MTSLSTRDFTLSTFAPFMQTCWNTGSLATSELPIVCMWLLRGGPGCLQEIRRLSAMLNEIYAKHTGQTAETIGTTVSS